MIDLHTKLCDTLRVVVNKIRQLREQKQWSQDDLAEYIGVPRQLISRWENNKTQPTMRYALKLARLFNEPIEKIFKLTD